MLLHRSTAILRSLSDTSRRGFVLAERARSFSGISTSSDKPVLPQPRQIKKFWKRASVIKKDEGYAITLDDRVLKTPLKQPFIVPTKLLAYLIAGEWESQASFIQSHTMPMTTLASAALDGPWLENRSRTVIIDQIMKYLQTDTVCFPHEYPHGLVQLEKELWVPLVDWIQKEYSVTLTVNQSETLLMRPHSPETYQKLRTLIERLNSWELIGFEHAVRASKSFVIALALIKRKISVDFAADAARAEVLFQTRTWGEVEDTHDVDEQDIRVRLGSAALFTRCLKDGLHDYS